MQRLKTILFIAAIGIISTTQAQYAFESKKAEKLYNELEQYYNDYDYESILENEEAIKENFLGKQDTLAALMNSFLGEAYLSWVGDMEKSLEYYTNEMAIREEIQDPSEYKDLIFNIAYLYDEMAMYDKSEQLYLDLLYYDEEATGKKSEEYFTTAYSLLDHYINTYNIKAGLELADDLKKLVKRNTYNEALVLRAFAELYTQTGELKSAEKNIVEAIEILEETGYYPSLEYVFFLNTMSFVYSDMGKLNLVEEILTNSLDILARLQGEYEEDAISIKSNLATMYKELGNHAKAEELFKEVRGFDASYYGEDSYSYGLSTYSLGANSFYAGEYFDAVEYFEEALSIFESVLGTNSLLYGQTANFLASTYTYMEEFESARQYSDIALKTFQQVVEDDNPEYAFPLYVAGRLYENLNELEKAEDYHLEALKLRRKVLGERHPNYALSARQLAILKWRQEELDESLEYYDETFDNYFAQINSYFPVLSEEEKSKFYYNNLKPTFEQFNSFIVENRSEDKELIELMYNYQLATKGLIFYATNKVRESILNSGDSSLIAKYDKWISQKEQLAKLFGATDLSNEERNRKIDSLTAISNDLEADLSEKSTAFADNFASRDLTWEDIRDRLEPGEAAIEIIRFRDFDPGYAGRYTDEVYYAALIVKHDTEEAPELVIMRNGKQMETRYLSNYRNAIRYRISENYSYRLFWRPIANRLGPEIKKVYFSPDGVYNQISIYTLQNPATKKYTIDEFEIQLVTNSKDLIASNLERKSDFSSDPSYLFGYPNYNMGIIDEEGENNETGSEAEEENEERGTRGGVRGARGERGNVGDLKELSRGGIPRGLRGNMLRYMRSNALLSLLPGTKKEVNLIDSLYKAKNASTVVLMEEEAVEDRIKEIENPPILHIATHGFFLELDPEDDFGKVDEHVENPLLRSGLILAGANSYIRYGEIGAQKKLNEDGILTAYEAMNLNLDRTELVILSACETGLGEVKNGEGVYGLQRAFKVAGADAIIMSMWTVDDDATQELMTAFYENWLSTGDKHKSFIAAQKQIKDSWKDPYYWGAFVMVGN